MLAWFKFQAKIPSRSGVCVKREWQKYTTPSPALSKDEKDERLRGIGHNISMGNLVMGFYSVTVTWFIKTVTKCDRYYYKMWQLIYYKTWQKFITKCEFYYKMRQSLQVATILLQNATFITNYDSAFIKISLAQTIYVIEIMSVVRCHLFCKSSCFLWVI